MNKLLRMNLPVTAIVGLIRSFLRKETDINSEDKVYIETEASEIASDFTEIINSHLSLMNSYIDGDNYTIIMEGKVNRFVENFKSILKRNKRNKAATVLISNIWWYSILNKLNYEIKQSDDKVLKLIINRCEYKLLDLASEAVSV